MNDITDTEENDNENETENAPRPTDRRPLGYWLRVVDGLLTREFAAALEAEGVTRRDWMLLNVLWATSTLPSSIERLARKGKRLRGLEEPRLGRRTRRRNVGAHRASAATEKERIGAIVDGIRSRIVAAVGDDEAYAALTGSLEAAIAREPRAGTRARQAREARLRRFRRLRGGPMLRPPGGAPAFGPEFRGHGFGPGWGPDFGGVRALVRS